MLASFRSVRTATRTICCQSLHRASRAERAGIGDTENGNHDDSIEDRREDLDASELNSDDERRVTRFRAFAVVRITVVWYDQSDEEEVDDVEDSNTPDDLSGSPWDLLLRISSFGSSKSSELSSSVCK